MISIFHQSRYLPFLIHHGYSKTFLSRLRPGIKPYRLSKTILPLVCTNCPLQHTGHAGSACSNRTVRHFGSCMLQVFFSFLLCSSDDSLFPLTLFSSFSLNALRLNAASITLRHAWPCFLLSIYGHLLTSCAVDCTAFSPSIAWTTFHLYLPQLPYCRHRLVRAPGLHLFK